MSDILHNCSVKVPNVSYYRRGFVSLFASIVLKHINPLNPNSDQHQISPCNINAYSTPEVIRIKDKITQGEFS